mgnify:CR=1 FL=1
MEGEWGEYRKEGVKGTEREEKGGVIEEDKWGGVRGQKKKGKLTKVEEEQRKAEQDRAKLRKGKNIRHETLHGATIAQQREADKFKSKNLTPKYIRDVALEIHYVDLLPSNKKRNETKNKRQTKRLG